SMSARRLKIDWNAGYICAGARPEFTVASTSSTVARTSAIAWLPVSAWAGSAASTATARTPRPRKSRRVLFGIRVNDLSFLFQLVLAALYIQQPRLRIAVRTFMQNRVHGRAELRPITRF